MSGLDKYKKPWENFPPGTPVSEMPEEIQAAALAEIREIQERDRENLRRQMAERKKREEEAAQPWTESDVFKALKARIDERAKNSLPIEEEKPISPLERDLLVIRHLVGHEGKFDRASLHHPEFFHTPATDWLFGTFKESGRLTALLLGPPGCGKSLGGLTYLVSEVNATVERSLTGKLELTRCGGRFIPAYKIGELLLDQKANQEKLRRLQTVRWLLIDDLGTEPGKLWGVDFLSYLEPIFFEREARCLPTIITSNASLEVFKQNYGDRIVSRISGNGLFKEFAGRDLRKETR
jgi:hypothetical protein